MKWGAMVRGYFMAGREEWDRILQCEVDLLGWISFITMLDCVYVTVCVCVCSTELTH